MNIRTSSGTFLLIFIVLMGALLFACAPSGAQPIASTTASAKLEPTASRTPTNTLTPTPSQTPSPTDILPIEKGLLTGYFDRPTATFDAAQVVTVTPAAVQECWGWNEDLIFDPAQIFPGQEAFESDEKMLNTAEKRSYLLDYLNNGGDFEAVMQMCREYSQYGMAYCDDLTGNGIPEIMLKLNPGITQGTFHIFGCMNGTYKQIYEFEEQLNVYIQILNIIDMNKDGLPEIVVNTASDHGFSIWDNYEILSWNGESMKSQISQVPFNGTTINASADMNGIYTVGLGEGYDSTNDQWMIVDIDRNGTLEFIVEGGLETHIYADLYEPSLPYKITFMWNGEGFVISDMKIGTPEYRFQAVQNGDLYTLMNEYDLARQSYFAAINDPDLVWWTTERREYAILQEGPRYDPEAPLPTLPPEDEDEYPNLAAYAQFRLILLDVLEGDLLSVEQKYAVMQETYQEGQAGSVYVDFVGAFLEEYQKDEDVHQACQAALDYGEDHRTELLRYFGEEQGFLYRLAYELTDLCPFE